MSRCLFKSFCHACLTCAVFIPVFLLHPSACSNLSNNRITDIEEGTFEGSSGVNELILTSNRLENVHHRMLKGLSGLRTLWVHTQSVTGSTQNDMSMHNSQLHKMRLYVCVCTCTFIYLCLCVCV